MLPDRDSDRGPDFICIGMQKAATGWLYDQVAAHPGFWMPPIKELHYFDRPFPRSANARRLAVVRDRSERGRDPRHRERDVAFFGAIELAYAAPPDRARYVATFAPAGSLRSGDITPGYSALPEDDVMQIASWLPTAKFILLIRDPVDRFWSAACMEWRKGRLDRAMLDDPDALRAFLGRPAMAGRSFPSVVADRWSRIVGKDRLGIFFFDDIVRAPDATRDAVLRFLGVPEGGWTTEAAYNRKAGREKVTMTEAVRESVTSMFRDELLACRRAFGSVAEGWCEKHGVVPSIPVATGIAASAS